MCYPTGSLKTRNPPPPAFAATPMNQLQPHPDLVESNAVIQAASKITAQKQEVAAPLKPADTGNLPAPALPQPSDALHPGAVIVVIVEGDLTPRPALHAIPGPDENRDTVGAEIREGVTCGQGGHDNRNSGRQLAHSIQLPRPLPLSPLEDRPVCGGRAAGL